MAKLTIIPRPTNAAVSLGERSANMASAPAETIGGIPASMIETCTAFPSSPAILQNNRAAMGAAISLMQRPMQSCDVPFLLRRNVSWKPTPIMTSGTRVEANIAKTFTARGG